MPKKLVVLFVIATSFIFGLAQVAQASSNDTLLNIRSTGADVVQLQTDLNYLGYNVGAIDGIFGVKTEAEVVAFQKANSITADGIVGSSTNNALTSTSFFK